jgi:hypothetical protein
MASPSTTHEPIVCFYRMSDAFQKNAAGESVLKRRPDWFDKRRCFENFVAVFGVDNLVVIADNVGEETYEWLQTFVAAHRIARTNYKSGAHSFLHAVSIAAKQVPDETIVYFCEDDWPHTRDAPEAIVEGLTFGDMVVLSDLPDKYVNAGTVSETGCPGNPLIYKRSEATRVFLGKKRHYKLTNSACMTFACRAKLVRQDMDVYIKYCQGGYPHDFQMFMELVQSRKRELVCPLPGCATHAETVHLTPLVDWERVLDETAPVK